MYNYVGEEDWKSEGESDESDSIVSVTSSSEVLEHNIGKGLHYSFFHHWV